MYISISNDSSTLSCFWPAPQYHARSFIPWNWSLDLSALRWLSPRPSRRLSASLYPFLYLLVLLSTMVGSSHIILGLAVGGFLKGQLWRWESEVSELLKPSCHGISQHPQVPCHALSSRLCKHSTGLEEKVNELQRKARTQGIQHITYNLSVSHGSM